MYIELINSREQGLGLPLPRGVVRVYKRDQDGGLQFVGEDRVDHTPIKERIRLNLGRAFDVTATRRQIDFRILEQQGEGREREARSFESAYEIILSNARNEPVHVFLEERIPGEWNILEESVPHQRAASGLATWDVEVPAEGSRTLSYRVKVRL